MAAAVRLETMLQGVRRRANIENQTAFISDAEITEYVNYGASEVYDMLVTAKGQDFVRATYNFTSNLNQDTYPLPGDFFQLMSVDINLGNNIILTARPFMESERNRFKWYPGWFYNMPVYYRLRGNNIVFIPAPSAAYSITLNYYPVYKTLSDPNDTFDGINGWEEYAVWHAVAACKGKADEDPSFAIARMADLRTKIEAMAADRAGYDAERVHDVYADYSIFGTYE